MRMPIESQHQPYGAPSNFGYGGGGGGRPQLIDVQGMADYMQAGCSNKRRVNEAMKLFCDAIQGKVDPMMLREAINPRTPYIVNELARRYPGIYGDPGGRRMLGLRETMSVTDYQALYVDVLDRLYYGYYNDYPITNMGLFASTPCATSVWFPGTCSMVS